MPCGTWDATCQCAPAGEVAEDLRPDVVIEPQVRATALVKTPPTGLSGRQMEKSVALWIMVRQISSTG